MAAADTRRFHRARSGKIRRPKADAVHEAAAPYLHPRLTAIDAKLSPANAEQPSERPSLTVEFVLPTRDHAREDR